MNIIKNITTRPSSIIYPLVYLCSAGIILVLLLTVPLSRQIGLTLRYDFFIPIIFFLAVFFPLFTQSNKYFKVASFITLLIIFALPLSGLWSSGQSEQYLLGGIIPFSDARGYFADTRSMVEGGDLFTSHSRRPLFSAFFAPILAITSNNLQLSLAILMIFSAGACYLAARELQSSRGSLPAIFLLILLFFFYRPISGKILSEGLGFPLAVLGLSFFIYSTRTKRLSAAFYGLFLVSLALVVRAGAFFMLPALLIWIFWQFHGKPGRNIRIILLGVIAVGLAFIINQVFYSLFVSSSHPAFGNFSYTFYGLAAGGKGWQQILVDYPEISALPEPEYSRKIMEISIQSIKNKPMNLVIGSLRSWAMFFSTDDYYSLFNWVNGSRPIVGVISRIGLYIMIILGFVDWLLALIKRRQDALQNLSVLTFLGIVLSVPFAPPSDANRMRVYASVMPFLLLLPTASFVFLHRWMKTKFLVEPRDSFSTIGSSAAISFTVLITLLVGPFITKFFAPSRPAQIGECLPGQSSVTIRLSPGSLVNVTEQVADKMDWLPNIRQNTFITRAHNLPNWETFPLFDNLSDGKTLANEIDLMDNRIILFIADTPSLPELPAVIQSCGSYSEDRMVREYNVFFADSIQVIE